MALESKPSDLALESKPSDLALESKPSDLAWSPNLQIWKIWQFKNHPHLFQVLYTQDYHKTV
jgi:hypothetical protein